MQINERLNLVIPIFGNDPPTKDAEGKEIEAPPIAYVHSMPISREVFEANYLLLSKTFAAIHGEGLGRTAGPRVAALLLNDIARQAVGERGDAAAYKAPLMNEIHRLSNVLLPGERGWETMPYEDAVRHHKLDDDDLAEVENAIVFFTAYSAMHRKRVLAEVLPGAVKLWGADVSSLNATEFAASLQTSTGAGTSAPKSTAPATPIASARSAPRGAVVEVAGVRRVASSLPV